MAIYTSLPQKSLEKIMQAYGLPLPEKVQGVLEGTVNTFYLLHFQDEDLFLKIDEVADQKRLSKELKILKFLAKNQYGLGFESPTQLRTLHGQDYLMLGRKPVLLFRKIAGKSIMMDGLKPTHLQQIGRCLAQMHGSSKGMKVGPHRFNIRECERIYHDLKPKLGEPYSRPRALITETLREAKQARLTDLPHGLIHADLFPENILFVGNRLNGILDFEASGKAPLLFDICVTLNACGHDGHQFKIPLCKAFLKGYAQVRPINKQEIKAFEVMMKLAALRFLLTRLRDFEFSKKGKNCSPFKDYREYVRRFDEIETLITRLGL